MTPQPQQARCVLTRHDVQSIKDLVFVIGGNAESSAQKAIFEILANNMCRSRPAQTPASDDRFLCHQSVHDDIAKRAAAQAREEVLALLDEWDSLNMSTFLKPHPTFHDMIRMVREKPYDMRKHIDTLKQEAQR